MLDLYVSGMHLLCLRIHWMKTGIKKKKNMHTGKIGRNAARVTQHLTCFKAFKLLIIIETGFLGASASIVLFPVIFLIT